MGARAAEAHGLQAVPEHIRGHTLGLAGAGMMTMQAVAAAGTGALATRLPAGTVMTIAAVASLLASMILIRTLVTLPAGKTTTR